MDLANYPACKLSILLGLGYNLKVRGSNPLRLTSKTKGLAISLLSLLFSRVLNGLHKLTPLFDMVKL